MIDIPSQITGIRLFISLFPGYHHQIDALLVQRRHTGCDIDGDFDSADNLA